MHAWAGLSFSYSDAASQSRRRSEPHRVACCPARKANQCATRSILLLVISASFGSARERSTSSAEEMAMAIASARSSARAKHPHKAGSAPASKDCARGQNRTCGVQQIEIPCLCARSPRGAPILMFLSTTTRTTIANRWFNNSLDAIITFQCFLTICSVRQSRGQRTLENLRKCANYEQGHF